MELNAQIVKRNGWGPSSMGSLELYPEGPLVLVKLMKMGPEDDPEAFLETFEWVTRAAHWPL